MQAPCIHMNGTSRQALLDQVSDAAWAVHAAQNALRNAAPNARDYYPLGNAAWAQAVAEHKARQRKLGEVYTELEALAEAIARTE